MSSLLLITRPQPDADALAEKLHALGYATLISPLLAVHPLPEGVGEIATRMEPPPLIVTSRAAIRALHALPHKRTPILCVGEATAELARETGWQEVVDCGGTEASWRAIVEHCQRHSITRAIYASGKEVQGVMVGTLSKTGCHVERICCYRAVLEGSLSPEVLTRWHEISAVTLLSARSAKHFLTLTKESTTFAPPLRGGGERKRAGGANAIEVSPPRHCFAMPAPPQGGGKSLRHMQAFAFSPAIAAILLDAGFAEVHTAATPSIEALLTCIKRYAKA
jgi:uroporphyrinogen-III synthase